MSISRGRLTPGESRSLALEAARTLLIEAGPQAVTLKAVASRIDRTHANLLHHFGSAAGLQAALASHLADQITAHIGDAVERARQGAGALAAWRILSGNRNALDPVLEAIHGLVDKLGRGHEDRPVHEITLWLVLAALGDSLLGAPMAGALGLARDQARALATVHLRASVGDFGPSSS